MYVKSLVWVILAVLIGVLNLSFAVRSVWAQPQGSNAEVEEVRTAVLVRMRANPTPATAAAQVQHVALIDNYALADVFYGEGGGEILLQQQQGQWQVITGGGGVMDTATLIQHGVPDSIAAQLVEQIQQQWRLQ